MRNIVVAMAIIGVFLFSFGCAVKVNEEGANIQVGGWSWPPTKISDCEGIFEKSDHRFSETRCYISLAESLKDASVCDRVADENAHKDCIFAAAQGKLDANLCKALVPEKRDLCISLIAKKSNNTALCFTLNSTFRHNCFYQCGFQGTFDCSENGQVATEGKSTYVFFPVRPAYSPNSCEHLINMSGNSVFEGCNELFFGNNTLEGNESSGSQEKEFCVKRQLYTECETLTRDICTGILGNYVYERQACLSAMAEWSADPSYCEKVTEEAGRAQCYYQYSLYYVDEAACKRIGNRTYPKVINSGAFYGDFSQSDCMTVVGYFK